MPSKSLFIFRADLILLAIVSADSNLCIIFTADPNLLATASADSNLYDVTVGTIQTAMPLLMPIPTSLSLPDRF